jgi:hypothetical protein
MPEKPGKLMPALYGGIIMGVISGIPFLNFVNCLCCAGIMLGGFMAVFFYKKDLRETDPPLTNADSLQLGALAGVFGAVVGVLLTVIVYFTLGDVAREAMKGMIMKFVPPEAAEQVEEGFREGGLSPISIILPFIIDPLFGLIGGVIGYSVFKSKSPSPVPPSPPSV